jgi:hypothetical protein
MMMTKLLTVILLGACITGHAAPIMYTKNNSLGHIVLTDESCITGTGHLAYATQPNAETLLGCWTSDDVAIHIYWSNKYLRAYDYTDWVIVKKDATM